MSESDQTEIQKLNFMSICDMAESNTNKISIDRYHIEIMGDLPGAAFLTQLRYWFSPTTNSPIKGQTRVRIRKEGKLWLAKQDSDWWEECYVTPKQLRLIKKKVIDLGIVEIKYFRFNGLRTTHYHLNLEKYSQIYHECRLVNADKESSKQKKQAVNNDLLSGSAQRASPEVPKGRDRKCPKGATHNISLQQFISSYNLKNHMENVLKILNDKEMSFSLKGRPLQRFKSLSKDRKVSCIALIALPVSEDDPQPFNPVQAVKMSTAFTPEEIQDALKVLEEHVNAGNQIKNVGSYVTWILEKGFKPESPNIKLNKHFWGSIKNGANDLGIIEHRDLLEIDDVTGFHFWMDHTLFKQGITEAIQNLRR